MKQLFLRIALATACVTFAQEASITSKDVHLREIPKHNLALDLGITQPLGNYHAYAGSGLSAGLTYEGYKNKHWGISIALRHQSNTFVARNASEVLTEPSNSYALHSLAIGPVYSYTKNRFQLDVSPRLGGLLLNMPSDGNYAITTNGATVGEINLNEEASSQTAFYSEVTVRFNYYFRRSVQVYAAPTITTAIGNPYSYNAFPQNEAANPSNFIFNIGVKIALGPTYSNGELRDDSF